MTAAIWYGLSHRQDAAQAELPNSRRLLNPQQPPASGRFAIPIAPMATSAKRWVCTILGSCATIFSSTI